MVVQKTASEAGSRLLTASVSVRRCPWVSTVGPLSRGPNAAQAIVASRSGGPTTSAAAAIARGECRVRLAPNATPREKTRFGCQPAYNVQKRVTLAARDTKELIRYLLSESGLPSGAAVAMRRQNSQTAHGLFRWRLWSF